MSQQAIPFEKTRLAPGSECSPSRPKADDRSRLLALLNERLRFESLLSRLSTTFINLPAEEVDSQIERGLQQIVEFLGIERSSLTQFSDNGNELEVTHSYSIPGMPPFPRMDIAAFYPWYTDKIRQGEVLRLARLPDDLPCEAASEREFCLRDGIQSHLVIPIRVGDSILGGIGFGSLRQRRDWPDDLVQSLQLVGEIFANALARRRADIAQRESEGRFRRMADAAPVMVWMSDPDKRCTYFNKPWLDFTGRPLQDQVGDGWSKGVHPDDVQHCLHTYVRAFDARQEFRMEYRLRRFDGEYRWLLDTGVPRFASDGTFEGYIGSCIDISEQKRVEEALRESEANFRFLLESTHAIPWVADAQTLRFTYIGPQARRLLGYPVDTWFEQDFWRDHIHPDDRVMALAFRQHRSHLQTDYECEYRMVAADGATVWIHDVVNVVAHQGAPILLRGFMIDTTARRQAEEESRTLREQLMRVGRVSLLGELTASIAHEVNQPLCAIVNNAQALERMLGAGGFVIEELNEALQDIAQDSQRASGVIARIRGLLKKVPAEHTPLDMNNLIREMVALLRGEMARRTVSLKLDLAERLPAVTGDRVQLQQVLLNLMLNAADAMDGLSTGRTITLRSAIEGVGAITVAVQDVGIGLDDRASQQLFEAFYTTKPDGMGMGLAICKSIIQAHGGRIWAEPQAGRGATFHLTLPAAQGANL
jgi:PAS domain S-box-containing protein